MCENKFGVCPVCGVVCKVNHSRVSGYTIPQHFIPNTGVWCEGAGQHPLTMNIISSGKTVSVDTTTGEDLIDE